ncbi:MULTISPECIES: hypothetical protein [Actinomyces]|uniref:Uncharacterized protein n=1 Tax=Actinomyces respiraculi TaxID=2744574 RepID=A0A7T0LJA9_9ACTO|nr:MULTISPECIES: hypothetical protein [Actinomyces]QPL04665.1 hypothetical protein ID810_07650 [Actinomyces respiraculi]
MSDSTDVNHEQSAAPRRSRREQRQAERAAEREAYLTGQQPLLTRREMRRLREEAEALRAAITAGEITEEQAQALQDPTLAGESMAVLAGVPAVSGPAGPVVISDLTDESADDELDDDDAPLLGAGRASVEQQGAEKYSSEEMTAIAAVETGVMGAFDLADLSLNAGGTGAASWDGGSEDAGTEKAEETRPAVPERRSLFGAVAQDTASRSQAPAQSEDVDGQDDVGQAPTSGLPAAAEDLLEDVKPVEDADVTSGEDPDDGAYDSAEDEEEGPAPEPPSTAARRPIVRIPAAVQGVRTVDLDTGELSSVQPVDDAFVGIENPQWKALRDMAPAVGTDPEDVPVSAATSDQAVEAPSEETAEPTVSPESAEEADEEFEDFEQIVAPVEEPEKRGKGRALLIALVVLVIVLVLATIVWFVWVRQGNVFSAQTLLDSLGLLII